MRDARPLPEMTLRVNCFKGGTVVFFSALVTGKFLMHQQIIYHAYQHKHDILNVSERERERVARRNHGNERHGVGEGTISKKSFSHRWIRDERKCLEKVAGVHCIPV